MEFDKNGKMITGSSKIALKKKEEPFRVSNAYSTQKTKKKKVVRFNGGVKFVEES